MDLMKTTRRLYLRNYWRAEIKQHCDTVDASLDRKQLLSRQWQKDTTKRLSQQLLPYKLAMSSATNHFEPLPILHHFAEDSRIKRQLRISITQLFHCSRWASKAAVCNERSIYHQMYSTRLTARHLQATYISTPSINGT